jgi:RNase P/RNase MRP subunit p29
LGVYDHPDPVKFDDVSELSSLWEIYASSFLAVLDSLQPKDCAPGLTPIEQRYSFISKKLELVGSTMVVKDSRNPQIVGVSGRVLRERKNVFEIIDPSNKVRTIPKGVCTFEVRVGPERLITIRGVDLLDR